MTTDFDKLVRSDLEYLFDTWKDAPTYSAVVRDSVVLRRLLVDGYLQRYRRLNGMSGEPQIWATDVSAACRALQPTKVNFFSASSVRYGVITTRARLDLWHKNQKKVDFEQYHRSVPLRKFLSEAGVIVHDKFVSRHDLIKYVANKLGGAHYDESRGAKDSSYLLLDKLKDLGFVWPRFVPDGATEPDRPMPDGHIVLELVAIGQALLTSADVATMIEAKPVVFGVAAV